MSQDAAGSEPGGQHDVPWWESGEAPERIALPRRRSGRVAAIIVVVVVTAAMALIIWGIAAGASSMGSMPM